jgi:hypothetical protein
VVGVQEQAAVRPGLHREAPPLLKPTPVSRTGHS